jgi:hypothetical protein
VHEIRLDQAAVQVWLRLPRVRQEAGAVPLLLYSEDAGL